MNNYVDDQLYRQIGEEVQRQEFAPGPKIRAVAESKGNKALVEGLYVKFRFQELVNEMAQRDLSERSLMRDQIENGIPIKCPKCQRQSLMERRARGNPAICLVLMLIYLIPGIIYGIVRGGYGWNCSVCGHEYCTDKELKKW